MPNKAHDMTGQRFGMWRVVERVENIGSVAAFLCECDCGTTSVVRGHSLRAGASLGCGCKRRQNLGNRARTHGKHTHRLYRTWMAMHDRCRREGHDHFHNYGGRGISVCDRWSDFQAFLDDMGSTWAEGLSLDRIDNDGDYTPDNCRWATQSQQLKNRRPRREITFNGETKSLTKWAEAIGLSPSALSTRLKKGVPLDIALTTPPANTRNRYKRMPQL